MEITLSTEKPLMHINDSKGTVLTVGAFLSFALLSEPALAQTTFRDCEGYMWHGGWVFGPIMMILFLALIVIAVVLLVRWLASSNGRPPVSRSDALAILQERFARGEIDKDDYDERRRILHG